MSRQALSEQIKAATQPMRIVGGNSKHFYGNDLSSLDVLSTAELSKIKHYEPAELVIQVEAGVKLETVRALLDENDQMLACEPPTFNGEATIGGMVATGISGSRRPYAGSVRDFVLGTDIITGAGDILSFGGQVMKNVAGYDVSRLMVGSMGTLGVITEASLKVLPKPSVSLSVVKSLSRADAHSLMLVGSPLMTASAYFEGNYYVRYSGAEGSVKEQLKRFDGDKVDDEIWSSIDNLSLLKGQDIWRVSVAPNSLAYLAKAELVDWGGGQRWLVDPETPPRQEGLEGHSTLVKSNQKNLTGQSSTAGTSVPAEDVEKFQPLNHLSMRFHLGLKNEFDPESKLNPNKMYKNF